MTRFGAVPELDIVGGRMRLHADDVRGHRQHDLVLLAVGVMRAEQVRQNRNFPEQRDAVGGARVGLLDQPAEDLRLAVPEPQQRVGVARTDLVRDRARGRRDLLQDRADLEVELDRHIAVQVDRRLRFQRQADIEVLHAACHHRGAAGRGRRTVGDHRLTAADQHLGLLLVAGADARARQGVGDARLFHGIQRDAE